MNLKIKLALFFHMYRDPDMRIAFLRIGKQSYPITYRIR